MYPTTYNSVMPALVQECVHHALIVLDWEQEY